MGIENVKLATGNAPSTSSGPQITDLATPFFKSFEATPPAMSIWMMILQPGEAAFPWWAYDPKIDQELDALNQNWNIPSAQGLFDCLMLANLCKFGGTNLFTIFPGCIKTS